MLLPSFSVYWNKRVISFGDKRTSEESSRPNDVQPPGSQIKLSPSRKTGLGQILHDGSLAITPVRQASLACSKSLMWHDLIGSPVVGAVVAGNGDARVRRLLFGQRWRKGEQDMCTGIRINPKSNDEQERQGV